MTVGVVALPIETRVLFGAQRLRVETMRRREVLAATQANRGASRRRLAEDDGRLSGRRYSTTKKT